MKLTKKLIVMGLLLALAGVTIPVRAGQESPPTPAPAPTETPAPETPAPETPAPETPAPTAPTAPTTPAPETPAPTAPTTPAPAPETPAPKTTKPVEQQLNGRIVAVDKTTKAITVQVNNQTYVLKTVEVTKFTKGTKTKSFDDLIVGEEVTVTVALLETESGRVEIAVVAVDLPTTTEAQGGKGNAYGYGIPPFVNLPNPANVGGGVRSPSN